MSTLLTCWNRLIHRLSEDGIHYRNWGRLHWRAGNLEAVQLTGYVT